MSLMGFLQILPLQTGVLLNAENFFVGDPVFDTHVAAKTMMEDTLSSPLQAVEVSWICSSCCCRESPGRCR